MLGPVLTVPASSPLTLRLLVMTTSHRRAVVSATPAPHSAPTATTRPSAGRVGAPVTTATPVKLPTSSTTASAAFGGDSMVVGGAASSLKGAVSVPPGP